MFTRIAPLNLLYKSTGDTENDIEFEILQLQNNYQLIIP